MRTKHLKFQYCIDCDYPYAKSYCDECGMPLCGVCKATNMGKCKACVEDEDEKETVDYGYTELQGRNH